MRAERNAQQKKQEKSEKGKRKETRPSLRTAFFQFVRLRRSDIRRLISIRIRNWHCIAASVIARNLRRLGRTNGERRARHRGQDEGREK
jgi:hypothetical protein